MISITEGKKTDQKHILNLSIILIIFSTVLLGIWALKETIALRNILLVFGTLFSIYYIVNEFKKRNLNSQLTFWKTLPICLLAIAFTWVIVHYLLFSIDSETQLKELKSTWLRAFLAAILGIGTALALRKNPNQLAVLWLGIFFSFVYLFYQYIPKAITQQKLLVPDYDSYIFHLKINTVLMGTILLAGIDGTLIDYMRMNLYRIKHKTSLYLIYWFSTKIMVLWAFVYIVDSRNGIGLYSIICILWICIGTLILIKKEIKSTTIKINITLLIIVTILSLIIFANLQTKVNKGWETLIEDIKIGVQIEKFQHYKNTEQMGYPLNNLGKPVTKNNYERIAWATAGSIAILKYQKGVGILSNPFSIHPDAPKKTDQITNIQGIATHSGWIELGLAFGTPILGIIFAAIMTSIVIAINGQSPFKMTVLGMLVLIIALFSTGEVAIDHGIEILFYMLALLPTLLIEN